MRVFVTGATGFVGSAVVQELLRTGHEVVGLSRSKANDESLTAAGAEIHRGGLEDLASLRAGIEKTDGAIHTGFVHDFTRFKEMCELDRQVIGAMGEALGESRKPFVITSAVGVLASGSMSTEDSRLPEPSHNPRGATEEAARGLIDRGLNVSIVRLPPSTHGEGDHGFVPMLIDIARAKKSSVYIAEGQNTWPAVHRSDAARIYVGALRRAEAGAYYHAVAESGIPFIKIAEVIGRRLNIECISKSSAEAAAHFGGFAHFAAMNLRSSSERTRAALDWSPKELGLIEDIDTPYYFR